MSEESERMMLLLQELAALKESDEQNLEDGFARTKRREEIHEEMKRIAMEKKMAKMQ